MSSSCGRPCKPRCSKAADTRADGDERNHLYKRGPVRNCAQRNNGAVEGDSPIFADTKMGTVPKRGLQVRGIGPRSGNTPGHKRSPQMVWAAQVQSGRAYRKKHEPPAPCEAEKKRLTVTLGSQQSSQRVIALHAPRRPVLTDVVARRCSLKVQVPPIVDPVDCGRRHVEHDLIRIARPFCLIEQIRGGFLPTSRQARTGCHVPRPNACPHCNPRTT